MKAFAKKFLLKQLFVCHGGQTDAKLFQLSHLRAIALQHLSHCERLLSTHAARFILDPNALRSLPLYGSLPCFSP